MHRLVLTFGAVALVGASQASAAETWRMTTIAPETSAYYQLFSQSFADRAAQMTGGEIVIEAFPGGVLAPPTEAKQSVLDGIADAAHIPPSWFVNENPANTFGAQPGGMGPETLMYWLYEGGGLELWREFRRENDGLATLVVGLGPTEILAHSHVPIRTADDLAGLKFRTSGAFANILAEYFDAAPTFVPGGEVYTMLERHGVDAAEWSTPAENEIFGLQDIAEFINIPGAHVNAWFFEVVVPTERWDALPAETQQQLEAAAKLATFDSYLNWGSADLAAMEGLRAGNNEIVELDPALVQAIRDAGRDWAERQSAEREAAGDPWMRRLTDSYYGFLDYWLANSAYRFVDRQ